MSYFLEVDLGMYSFRAPCFSLEHGRKQAQEIANSYDLPVAIGDGDMVHDQTAIYLGVVDPIHMPEEDDITEEQMLDQEQPD